MAKSLMLLNKAWCAETSADPGWSEDNPALGQCAVTALLIQDICGGVLLRSEVNGISHYWNLIENFDKGFEDEREVELDLTRCQFEEWYLTAPVTIRDRQYLLDNKDTKRRYELLKDRLSTYLNCPDP